MAGTAQGIRAGRAYVELATDNAKLDAGLAKAQQTLRAFGSTIASAGAGLMAAGAAIVAPIALAAKSFASQGSAAADAANRTGLTTEAFSELSYAAKQTGSDASEMEAGFRRMQKTLGDAAAGGGPAADKLSAIGVSIGEMIGLAPDEQFAAIAEQISRIADPAQKAAAAMEVFGKGGAAILPMMLEGSQGIAALRAEARRMGASISTTDAAAADALGDSIDAMTESIQSAVRAVGGAMAPVLTDMAKALASGAVAVGQWVREHQGLVTATAAVGAAVAATGASLFALGKAFQIAGLAAGAYAKAVVLARVVSAAMSQSVSILATGILNDVARIMAGVKALWAAVLANPIALAAGVMVAAFAAVAVAATVASKYVAKLNDESDRALATGDKQRGQDLQRMERLRQLSNLNKLSADQMKEARTLVGALMSRYGNFGVQLDETNGRVVAAAGAFDRLANAMTAVAQAQIEKDIAETTKNIGELNKEIENVPKRVKWNPFTSEETRVNEVEEIAAKRAAEFKKLQDLRARRRALAGGDRAAIAGAETPAGPKLQEAEPDKAATEWARKVHILKLEQMRDEHARQLALINERYDHEAAKARDAGASPAVLADIERARGLEISAAQAKASQERARTEIANAYEVEQLRLGMIENEHERALALIDAKAAHEKRLAAELGDADGARHAEAIRAAEIEVENAREALRAKERIATVDQANADRAATIAELDLATQYSGKELEQRRLELQRQAALEKARKAGEDLDLVNREFDLRQRILEAEKATDAAKVATVGGFNAANTLGFQGSGINDLVGETRNVSKGIQDLRKDIKGRSPAFA